MYIKLFTLWVYSFHRNSGIYCVYISIVISSYFICIQSRFFTICGHMYIYIYVYIEPKLICVNTYYTYTYQCVRTTPFVVHESMICLIYTLCVICLKKMLVASRIVAVSHANFNPGDSILKCFNLNEQNTGGRRATRL